jgi:hypothetical protein
MEQQERLAQLRNRKSAQPAYAGRIVAAGLSTSAFLLGIASLAASAKVASTQVESPAVLADVSEPMAVLASDPPATGAPTIAPTTANSTTTAAPATAPPSTAR